MSLLVDSSSPFNATPQRYLHKPVEALSDTQIMKLWQHRPHIFLKDNLDLTLDTWQEECLHLYMTNQRLGMIASKGVGKTSLLSFIIWHFFMTKHQPKIACLSVSREHLSANLWAELHMWRDRSDLFKLSTNEGASRITLKGKEPYSFIDARAYAKSANEDQQASALAGHHADNVMFAIDEAGTIPDAVLATADAALAVEESNVKCARLLVTANPEQPKGTLYRASKGLTKQKWAIYKISGDPLDPKRASRVPISWAQEQIDVYGRDNPWVQINVLAQYPSVASESLFTEDEILQAMNREFHDEQVKNSQMRLGIDVARGGADFTTLVRRKGLKVYPIETVSSALTGPEVAGMAALRCRDHKIERTFVDNTGGYGSAVVDALKISHYHIDVTPIFYNATAQDNNRYFNKRTEMWMRLRDHVRNGGALPKDTALAQELLSPKIFFMGGKARLEEKDQIKSRIGKSPDRADALAQTFADIEQESFYSQYGAEYNNMEEHEMRRRMGHIAYEWQQDGRYSNSNHLS